MLQMANATNIPIKDKNNKSYDINNRIYNFIVRVIKLTNKLPKTSSNIIIVNQILRSVTSMGANDQEADGTITKKDFLHCCTIVRKEAKETLFWLLLTADTNDNFNLRMQDILQENKEIIAIISSIINKTKINN